MRPALTEDQFLLAYTIRTIAAFDLSPRWEQYREYILWHMLLTGRRAWGRFSVGEDNLAAVQLLSGRVGGWIYVDAEQREAYLPLAEWQQHYEQGLRDYPDILRFF
jgi:hypothetical protein